MIQIVIRGFAAVFREGVQVTDPTILSSVAGLEYEDEVLATLAPPILGLSAEKIVLAKVLNSSVDISFGHREGDQLLTVTTVYRSRQPLTQAELRALVSYTKVEWGDGIGKNLTHCPIHDEYDILCLWSKELVEEYSPMADMRTEYPTFEVTEE